MEHRSSFTCSRNTKSGNMEGPSKTGRIIGEYWECHAKESIYFCSVGKRELLRVLCWSVTGANIGFRNAL